MASETKIVESKKRQRSTSENRLEDKYITEYKIEKIEMPETTEIKCDEKQSSPLPCDNFESEEETIFKHIKKLQKSSKFPSCSAKRNKYSYVDMMIKYTKSLKDQEHQKQLEILEMELNIQNEKLKSAILEREILEIRKAKMDKQ